MWPRESKSSTSRVGRRTRDNITLLISVCLVRNPTVTTRRSKSKLIPASRRLLLALPYSTLIDREETWNRSWARAREATWNRRRRSEKTNMSASRLFS